MDEISAKAQNAEERGTPKHNVKIIALGGLGEIGKNMYVIEYGEEIVVVDAGVKFPRSDLPGVDYVIPNIEYLVQHQDKVKGIFLTHGHEDHIGGLPFILRELRVPVYGAPLTIGLVRAKLEEHKLDKLVHLQVVKEETVIQLDKLRVHFFHTNHSIPDSLGVAVDTPEGIIVHTGDFKFDMTPVGHRANIYKMSELGSQGVLALLADSTNSEKPGYTPSEKSVGAAVYDTFRTCEGRILFATFASNVHRLQQVVEAAEATGRKIAIQGRSMERVFRIAQELGYIRIPQGMQIDIQQLDKFEDRRIVIICTGSQGEPNAALSRIASGAHSKVQIHPGDTVIFSSSPIPGNTQNINKNIDLLFRAGANVIYGSVIDIHASGHGCQEDLKLMLSLIKPKFLVPIHGEYRMLLKHAQLAEELGITQDRSFVLDIGEVLHLNRRQARKGRKVPSGEMLVSGNKIGQVRSDILADRRHMSNNGVILVLMVVNEDWTAVLSGPELISRGFVFVKEASEIIQRATALTRRAVSRLIKQGVNTEEGWKARITEVLSSHLEKTMQRTPLIVPILTHLERQEKGPSRKPSRPRRKRATIAPAAAQEPTGTPQK
ncbi:ribonuclease J1 [Paenibacillus sp. S-38]|uniref:ribonuclease J1 n=1 Tax=Paenibacillus sp. S-38 TaxID=3416710 RepID=UPI003CEF5947